MSQSTMSVPSSVTVPVAELQHQQRQQQQQQQQPSNGAAAGSLTQQQQQQQQQQQPAAPPPPPSLPQRHWWDMTRTIAHYERIEQIGEGTYGQVYKARCKDTGRIVALKKIRLHHQGHWGCPPTVIREIKILKRLRHPNLVQMVEVVSSKGVEYLDEDDEPLRLQKKNAEAASGDGSSSGGIGGAGGGGGGGGVKEASSNSNKHPKKDRVVDGREKYKGNLFLVLEYVSHDLTGLMDVAFSFSPLQVKSIFQQLLQALQYMHENKYVHRDIKSSNILIDTNFRLKLADFGLARNIEPPILDRIHDRGNSQEFTNKVITLWYRPPELLLGETRYGPAVDIWSAGCILAELILGKPLFTGKSDMDQLKLVFDLMGTPTAQTWEGFQNLKLLRTGEVTIDKQKQPRFREKYSGKIPTHALNLIERLLELDPAKRLTADRALESRYFLSEPRAPLNPEDMGQQLDLPHFHEFQTKKKRREAKAEAETIKQAALDGGHSQKEAQGEYDRTYRQFMAKVAKEGLSPPPEPKTAAKVPAKEEKDEKERGRGRDDKPKSDKSERRKSSREKVRDGKGGDDGSRSKEHRRSSKDKEHGERDRERSSRGKDRDGSRRDKSRDDGKDRSERRRSKSRTDHDDKSESRGRSKDLKERSNSARRRTESDERRKKRKGESSEGRRRKSDGDGAVMETSDGHLDDSRPSFSPLADARTVARKSTAEGEIYHDDEQGLVEDGRPPEDKRERKKSSSSRDRHRSGDRHNSSRYDRRDKDHRSSGNRDRQKRGREDDHDSNDRNGRRRRSERDLRETDRDRDHSPIRPVNFREDRRRDDRGGSQVDPGYEHRRLNPDDRPRNRRDDHGRGLPRSNGFGVPPDGPGRYGPALGHGGPPRHDPPNTTRNHYGPSSSGPQPPPHHGEVRHPLDGRGGRFNDDRHRDGRDERRYRVGRR